MSQVKAIDCPRTHDEDRATLRQAAEQKSLAAEVMIAYVRVAIVLFGGLLLAITPLSPADRAVAFFDLIVAGIYSAAVYVTVKSAARCRLQSSYLTMIADALLIVVWIYSTGGVLSSTYVLVFAAILSVAFRFGERETIAMSIFYALAYVGIAAAKGQHVTYGYDLFVRSGYFLFFGVLGAGFAHETFEQVRAKIEMRGLAENLAKETEERARAEAALARHAEELERRIDQRTAELREAKEQVETILVNSVDAVLLIRADGTVQQVNPAFYQLLGVEQLPNAASLAEFVNPDDLPMLLEAVELTTTTGEPMRVEIGCRRGDGMPFDADVAISRVHDRATDRYSIIYSLRDITEHKQAEASLRVALDKEREVNELKSRFVSTVSHEFRTPLASIKTSAQILERYSDRLSPEKQAESFARIHSQISQLTDMLDDLLTLNRAEALSPHFAPTPADLGLLCRECVEEMQLIAPNHSLQLTVIGEPTVTHIDANLMRHAMNNVLSNAIKYSPGASDIDIRLRYHADQVVFSVSDHGIGIPEADQQHLFEVFHRAANVGMTQGTGLGLAIVKNAVDAHGGSIRIDSAPGRGTSVAIALPLQQPIQAG